MLATCHVTLFGCRMGETWVTLVRFQPGIGIETSPPTSYVDGIYIIFKENNCSDFFAQKFSAIASLRASTVSSLERHPLSTIDIKNFTVIDTLTCSSHRMNSSRHRRNERSASKPSTDLHNCSMLNINILKCYAIIKISMTASSLHLVYPTPQIMLMHPA